MMQDEDLDGLFVYSDAWRKGSVCYITGFSPFAVAQTPANAALVFIPAEGDPTLFVGWPIMIKEAKELSVVKDVCAMEDISSKLDSLQKNTKLEKIGICGKDIITVSVYDMIRKSSANFQFLDSDIVYRLRLIKSDAEIKLMKKAAEITDEGMQAALKAIEEGKPEPEIAKDIEISMILHGADVHPSIAFSTVVLSGPRSEYVVGRAYKRRIQKGDLILLDFGAIYKGYTCDIARTIGFKISEEQEHVLNLVIEGHRKGREAIKPNVKIDVVDKAIGNFMKEADYEKYRVQAGYHATGMEQGDVLPDGKDTILRPNMTLNVLSNLFVPGVGGARIEDNMLVTSDGSERLVKSKHKLFF
jgi:Xaa-Pro aminopeptidase